MRRTEKPSWHERHVLMSAGLREEDFTDNYVDLAREALERCYYHDRATEYVLERLNAKRERF